MRRQWNNHPALKRRCADLSFLLGEACQELFLHLAPGYYGKHIDKIVMKEDPIEIIRDLVVIDPYFKIHFQNLFLLFITEKI